MRNSKKASFDEEAFFNPCGTFIHPSAIIGPGVFIDENVKIGPHCVVTGNTTIGTGTRLFASVIVGFPAQVRGLYESLGHISIGKNCEIREFATIHAARAAEGKTTIGDNCYIMNYCHISHDCTLENDIVLVNNVQLGGHTYIEHHAFLMANAVTHQFCRIGQFTALAPFGGTRQDLPPFCLFHGQPAAFASLNTIALKRAGMTTEILCALKHVSKLFYQDKLSLTVIKDLAQQEPQWGCFPQVTAFISFVEQSTRGVSRKTLLNANTEEETV